MAIQLETVARRAGTDDNAAIALRFLARGTTIAFAGEQFTLRDDVLEGHRFAIRPIPTQAPLLSWNLPFGIATRPIAEGDAVMNVATLMELQSRDLDIALPVAANFRDEFAPYQLPDNFTPSLPLPQLPPTATFQGYRRAGERGVGTRNVIILLATNAHANSFVTALEERLATVTAPNLDGIKAVAHTEGSTARANNRELVLRTLAGWMVHPNVAAVLAVDYGDGVVNNDVLATYMRENGYPLDAVAHRFATVAGGFSAELDHAEQTVRDWLPLVAGMERSVESISHLKIALQCGGSDAFSGISGNPLVGWVAHQLAQQGGSALLAETDELIGAEAYIVAHAQSRAIADRFVRTVERFKTWAGRHGVSPEGNPSGGNRLRGLYNIALKSLGAAMKKHPDTPLAGVVEYGERLSTAGYHFMDSPGNDLESIAGQVAAGCNVIFFVTGNGSITNFPFVPTLKVVTTSRRYDLLRDEMDINAGVYLDGTTMNDLGAMTLDLLLETASGRLTKGEIAGHTQVQIWRDWKRGEKDEGRRMKDEGELDGEPIAVEVERREVTLPQPVGNVGLVLPTSLCSGQVARLVVERLNGNRPKNLNRIVTLVHTEGCGASSNSAELFDRTLIGYANHRLVSRCLLLEHGCEKTHNDYFRQRLSDESAFGYASIQQDGGIANVLTKIEDWFQTEQGQQEREAAPPRIALAVFGALDGEAGERLRQLIDDLLGADCTVVLPEHNAIAPDHAPTLAYGQVVEQAGLHIMQMPTLQWGEVLTGLGVSADLIVAYSQRHAPQGHPLIPVVRVGADADFDVAIDGDLMGVIEGMLVGDVETRLSADTFQLARGELGISL